MLINYLLLSFRNLKKSYGISVINILGLAIGISCGLLIALYVADELSYDRQWPDNDYIYRIGVDALIGNQDLKTVRTPSILSRTIVTEYPEIQSATRLLHTPNMLVRYGDVAFNEQNFLWVDTNFFDIFPLKVLYGDPKTALKDDHTVVMTLDNATKFFGNPADAIDKVVNYEDGTPYRVSGVVENPTRNCHFHYGMLSTFSSWEWNWEESWLNNFFLTYIRLHPDAGPTDLESKFPRFLRKYATAHLQREAGMNFDEMEKSGGRYKFFLQPLTDIHLRSHYDGELEANSDIKYVYIFITVAIFILIIACINYVNLSTSRLAGRSREVGIRKSLGATKQHLIMQFLAESILICLLAVLLSMILTQLILPSFNVITGKNIALNYFRPWFMLPGLFIFGIILGLISGIYPAFFLSSFQPAVVLKENLSMGLRGRSLRSILVVFQFSISIVLFISTFLLFKQLHYIQNKRLGFAKENVVVIKRGWAIGQNPDGSLIEWGRNETAPIDVFKAELLKNPRILAVAGSTHLPGELYANAVLIRKSASDQEQHVINWFQADYDYATTFGLELTGGRWFEREYGERQGVVINETAARIFGLEKPYTEQFLGVPNDPNESIPIVGVIKDYHYESLHKPIQPLAISLENLRRTYLCVRIRPEEVSKTIAYIEQVWNKFLPYKPFEFFIFDDYYNRLYQSEQRTGTLFSDAAILAILIACLGLFGLASFTTERRIREIGIRKALGANVADILILIAREFARLV
ncbi:MAG: ABC transporter permease, partial [Candidatus Neomarinimicrobiota bacterium]